MNGCGIIQVCNLEPKFPITNQLAVTLSGGHSSLIQSCVASFLNSVFYSKTRSSMNSADLSSTLTSEWKHSDLLCLIWTLLFMEPPVMWCFCVFAPLGVQPRHLWHLWNTRLDSFPRTLSKLLSFVRKPGSTEKGGCNPGSASAVYSAVIQAVSGNRPSVLLIDATELQRFNF